MLGDVTKKYESGKAGIGAISSGYGDPGGQSYGTYQLSIKTGTLQRYLAQSAYKSALSSVPGSAEFNLQWKQLAKTDLLGFSQDQHDYIKRTHYDPLRTYATELGFSDTPAINEALWSMAIQHGKASKILDKISDPLDMTEEQQIKELYLARVEYVKQIPGLERVLPGLLSRYAHEQSDILHYMKETLGDCEVADCQLPAPPTWLELVLDILKGLIK